MEDDGASRARSHLSMFVEQVRRGTTVLITRHSARAARLVPPDRTPDVTSAIAAVREARIGVTLEGDLKAMRDEGRH